MPDLQERYRLLVQLGQLVNSTLDLRKVFGRSAREIRKLLGCERVSLVLVRGGQFQAGYALEFGDKVCWSELAAGDWQGSAAQWVAQQRRPRRARRDDPPPCFADELRLWQAGYQSLVWLPLVCRTSLVAVLGLATRSEAAASAWQVSFLEELGRVLAIAVDNAAAWAQIHRLSSQLERENLYLRDEIRVEQDFTELVGPSRALDSVRRAISQVAATDSTVLILGETGTGKELIARAIHESSPRRPHLLVKVNCAALAPALIASELFGHEAGAFTGARRRRPGRFELAHQGTIFLDEIAEVPLETQVLLLRVLQERVIERVGGHEPIAVDVRVIAATNRDLEAALSAGTFRADLYYRLNVFPIRVPPLRERLEDIEPLLAHFVARFARRMHQPVPHIPAETLRLLKSYSWPGNVRELENIVERAMIVSGGGDLEVDPRWLARPEAARLPDGVACGTLAEQERRAIREAIQQSGGRIYGPGGAAQRLGLPPTTLYGKMRRLGIRRNTDFR